jgi:hypothetical protein
MIVLNLVPGSEYDDNREESFTLFQPAAGRTIVLEYIY